MCEGQHDVFLVFSTRALGAIVDAAVPGIEDDQRPCIAIRLRRRFDWLVRRVVRRTLFKRDVAQEAGAIRHRHVEDEPGRLALRRIEHKCLVEMHRPFGVDDDAGAALHDHPVAKRLHQPPALLGGFGRQIEGDLWQVDHHAIGVCERECGHVDLAIQIDNETRLLVVPTDAHIGCDHRLLLRWRQRTSAPHCSRRQCRPSRKAAHKPVCQ